MKTTMTDRVMTWLLASLMLAWICVVWAMIAVAAIWLYRSITDGPGSHVGIQAQAMVVVSRPSVRESAAVVSPIVPAVDEYAVIQWPRPEPDYFVCVPELPVRGAPGEEFPALYWLQEGDVVQIRERSRGTLGWAMIDRGRWVWEQALCAK